MNATVDARQTALVGCILICRPLQFNRFLRALFEDKKVFAVVDRSLAAKRNEIAQAAWKVLAASEHRDRIGSSTRKCRMTRLQF